MGILKKLINAILGPGDTNANGRILGATRAGNDGSGEVKSEASSVGPTTSGVRWIVFTGFKGGTGKSAISAQTALLLSALGRRVLFVDTDISNATGTKIILSMLVHKRTPLRDAQVSFLRDYVNFARLLTGTEDKSYYIAVYRYDAVPTNMKVVMSIPRCVEGVNRRELRHRLPINNLYFIPAKPPGVEEGSIRLTGEMLGMRLSMAKQLIDRVVASSKIDTVIIDTPPLDRELALATSGHGIISKAVLSWASELVFVVPGDPATVSTNLKTLLWAYDELTGRTRRISMVVANMVNLDEVDPGEFEDRIHSILRGEGINTSVHLIRYDEVWRIQLQHLLSARPPVAVRPPCFRQGGSATDDLMKMILKLRLVDGRTAEERLGLGRGIFKPYYQVAQG